jgi:hypothetical protein
MQIIGKSSAAFSNTDDSSPADRGGPLAPRKKTAPGYCVDCKREVLVEYTSFWMGAPGDEPPNTCLECGGHDVELLAWTY